MSFMVTVALKLELSDGRTEHGVWTIGSRPILKNCGSSLAHVRINQCFYSGKPNTFRHLIALLIIALRAHSGMQIRRG